ncbi:MAG: hupB [Gammaproteobacteria bacterium]|jgi:DNA-binding protein HU-beta|nr:hupB [Gammaproteobacteria bacterium]
MAERKSKADVVSEVASITGLTKVSIGEVVDAFLETVQTWVASGSEVVFIGFGTFGVSERAARTGRNPQTGATIKIAAANSPKFKPGKAFKDKVNTKKKK